MAPVSILGACALPLVAATDAHCRHCTSRSIPIPTSTPRPIIPCSGPSSSPNSNSNSNSNHGSNHNLGFGTNSKFCLSSSSGSGSGSGSSSNSNCSSSSDSDSNLRWSLSTVWNSFLSSELGSGRRRGRGRGRSCSGEGRIGVRFGVGCRGDWRRWRGGRRWRAVGDGDGRVSVGCGGDGEMRNCSLRCGGGGESSSEGLKRFGGGDKGDRWKCVGFSVGDGGGKSRGRVRALWSWGEMAEEEEEDEEEEVELEVEEEGEISRPLKSIADFTRFRDNGDEGAELQTAVISYRKPFPWSLFRRRLQLLDDGLPSILHSRSPERDVTAARDIARFLIASSLCHILQVDLVAAVHIADKEYFGALQEEFETYDRVLYEMVAEKNPKHNNRNVKYRWRPPKHRRGGRGGNFSLIGFIQRFMAQILTLDFQLECMDYRRENWFHADLDFATFQKLQSERGETFFSFAKDLTEISSKTVLRSLETSNDMEPWRSKLLWIARVFPMPLAGLLFIESVCAPEDAPLQKSPEMKALLDLDLPSALKVYLAKQITTDLTDGASSIVENSVIIGERNRVAMEELEEAIREGCNKIAIFYGSGHLPDMDTRLRKQFGLEPTDLQWRTAWSIKRRNKIREGALTTFLASLAKVSGWPLNRYQTLALLFLAGVLAVDLWFWEIFLGTINDYAQQTIVVVVNLLERGWEL